MNIKEEKIEYFEIHLKQEQNPFISNCTDVSDIKGERAAIIIFKNEKFEKCEYTLGTRVKKYNRNDWKFLKKIAEKIEKIENQFEEEKL